MATEDMRRRVERCADALSVELFEGITTGVAGARAMLRALPNRHDYPHLLPLNARAWSAVLDGPLRGPHRPGPGRDACHSSIC